MLFTLLVQKIYKHDLAIHESRSCTSQSPAAIVPTHPPAKFVLIHPYVPACSHLIFLLCSNGHRIEAANSINDCPHFSILCISSMNPADPFLSFFLHCSAPESHSLPAVTPNVKMVFGEDLMKVVYAADLMLGFHSRADRRERIREITGFFEFVFKFCSKSEHCRFIIIIFIYSYLF